MQGKIQGIARSGKAGVYGDFHIEFPSKTFGPYNYVFHQENLYFSEDISDRGAALFPLQEKKFENTEIFLERDDIIICVGVRGSFSGQEKLFVEFVNLSTETKYRFFPEEVSLIYHTQETLICCYKDEAIWKRSEFSLNDFSLISETNEHISAFFKLLYQHEKKEFSRIIYKEENYFFEMPIENFYGTSLSPISFHRTALQLECNKYKEENERKYIDVWQASLTGEL